jgi:uncharacterized protein YdaU (DUF1376 family)
MKVLTINYTPADFVAQTRHLSVEDRGAYHEICDQIVILGQDQEPPSLPDDDTALANMLGWSVAKWRKTKARLCEGPLAVLEIANGRLTQVRTAFEVLEAKERIAKASIAGQASGVSRKKKAIREEFVNGRSTGVRTGVQLTPELGANSEPTRREPITNHESRREAVCVERASADAFDAEAGFESLIRRYPVPTHRVIAMQSYAASVRSVEDHARCEKALDNYLAHLQTNPMKQIQNAGTWFASWSDWENAIAFVRDAQRTATSKHDSATQIGGAPAAVDRLTSRVLAFVDENRLRREKTPEKLAAFAREFGFSLDEWNAADDNQVRQWAQNRSIA